MGLGLNGLPVPCRACDTPCGAGEYLAGENCDSCFACQQPVEANSHWTGPGSLDDSTSCAWSCDEGHFLQLRTCTDCGGSPGPSPSAVALFVLSLLVAIGLAVAVVRHRVASPRRMGPARRRPPDRSARLESINRV